MLLVRFERGILRFHAAESSVIRSSQTLSPSLAAHRIRYTSSSYPRRYRGNLASRSAIRAIRLGCHSISFLPAPKVPAFGPELRRGFQSNLGPFRFRVPTRQDAGRHRREALSQSWRALVPVLQLIFASCRKVQLLPACARLYLC